MATEQNKIFHISPEGPIPLLLHLANGGSVDWVQDKLEPVEFVTIAATTPEMQKLLDEEK